MSNTTQQINTETTIEQEIKEVLTFVSKENMTKVFYQDKWYKAGGGGYNKISALLHRLFKDKKIMKHYISEFKVSGWYFETIEVRGV